MKLILASQSPRRKQILQEMGYEFEVCPSQSQEYFDLSLSLDEALKKVALDKAKDVQKKYPNDIILAADTIVSYQGEILGKPNNFQEAFTTLSKLSNSIHEVKTGVVILVSEQVYAFVSTSKIHFRSLTKEEIEDYINTYKPYDKAGSYGIQESDFVKSFEGDYDNIVGLPRQELKEILDLIHV